MRQKVSIRSKMRARTAIGRRIFILQRKLTYLKIRLKNRPGADEFIKNIPTKMIAM